MNKGDIIVFGSTFSPHKEKLFVVDTVFVISEKIAYHPKEAREKLALVVPSWYFHLTLDLVPDNEEYFLFIGATYQNQVNGMFSFFPCTEASAKPEGFIRPIIKSNVLKINGHNQGAGRFKDVTAKFVWDEIVNSVLQGKLSLGLNARFKE
jgi:hypothetical protein